MGVLDLIEFCHVIDNLEWLYSRFGGSVDDKAKK